MTIGSILLGIALFLLVVLFLTRPFLRHLSPATTILPPQQTLLAQKNDLLNTIRALDFDHETGKIPTAVYHPQRQQLIAQAARLLEQIENLAAPPFDAEIEAAIATYRQATPTGHTCPNCGQPTDPTDNFCAACGHQLTAAL